MSIVGYTSSNAVTTYTDNILTQNRAFLACWDWDGGFPRNFLDSQRSLIIGNTGNPTVSDVNRYLGASSNDDGVTQHTFCYGDIAEVVIYNQKLTDPERHIVENYLKKKWGISLFRDKSTPSIVAKFGVISDLHYASKDNVPATPRYFREGVASMSLFVDAFNSVDVCFVIQLGDLVEGSGLLKSQTLTDIAAVKTVYDNLDVTHYYVLGNHDVDNITLSEFTTATGMDATGYYSFDVEDTHFIVLDANYSEDDDATHYTTGHDWHNTYIPPAERTWLTNDLVGTAKSQVIVFCHQRLDTSITSSIDYIVDNAAAVRTILESSGKVKAVLTGHNHINYFNIINNIPYYVLMAPSNNLPASAANGIVNIHSDGNIPITGFNDTQQTYLY